MRLLVFLLLLALARGVVASELEPLKMLPEAEACSLAQEKNRLLLLVCFSDDFTKSHADTPAARVYRTLISRDTALRELLDEKFVVGFRHVGQPTAITTVATRDNGRVDVGEHAIAFFVTPYGRVIDFVPGVVDPASLRSRAEAASTLFADIGKLVPAQQPSAVAAYHEKSLATERQKAWLTAEARSRPMKASSSKPLFEPTNDGAAEQSKKKINSTVLSALALRNQELAARFGAGRLAGVQEAIIASLAAQGQGGDTFAHAVLSQIPLTLLEDLANPIWTAHTGHRFWARSSRSGELADEVDKSLEKKRAVLFVVRSDPSNSGKTSGGSKWPPKDEKLHEVLPRVDSFEMTLDELAEVFVTLGLDPLRVHPRELPRFVVLNAEGKTKVVLAKDDMTRLVQGLNVVLAADKARASKSDEVKDGSEK